MPQSPPLSARRCAADPLATRRGMVAVWTAVLMVVLIGFMGLALDAGKMVNTGAQLSSTADGAALAGALYLGEGPARVAEEAARVAALNSADGQPVVLDPADVVVGTFKDKVFTPGGEFPNAVRVTAQRTAARGSAVTLNFGALFGAAAADLTRTATAVVGGSALPGILVLDPSAAGALRLESNASIRVLDGSIQVNSSHACAARTESNARIYADSLNVVGGACLVRDTVTVNSGVPAMADPLASLPAPAFPAPQPGVVLRNNETRRIGPGYYTGGLNTQGSSVLYLDPGIYILGGVGLLLESSTRVVGDGVMIYITGTGRFEVNSSSTVILTPPDPAVHTFPGASVFAGITIFQDRANAREASLNSASDAISGTMYLPAAPVSYNSSSEQLALRLIVRRLVLRSSSDLTVRGPDSGDGGRPYLVQ
ncbi:MAG: pilus assembly protein TadG-related protein [Phycisphaerales bacterium]